MIPWWKTEFGEPEIRAVTEAIKLRCISQGAITRQFEEALAETLGVPYVVCTTSGTTALTIALLAAGVGPGDEVIVPDRTWIATAHAVMMTGAKVVLKDVNEEGLLPARSAEGNLALPVNLNGRMAPCRDLIEDSCQAFPAPPRGLAACYSLSVAKIISTGQGGFVATRDEGFYRELKALRTHDIEDAHVPTVLTWKRFGYNFRFTDLQAAIGLAQLKRLPERLDKIRAIHALYQKHLPMQPSPTPLYNELLHPEQERLRAYLLERGIEARPFYPCLHTAPYLHATGEFPNSLKFASGVILPSGPCQELSDIERVCEIVNDFR